MTAEPERSTLRRLRQAGRLVALLGVLAGIALLATHREAFDPRAIQAAVTRYPAAPLAFLALQIVASMIFLPRTVLGIVAGAVFGPWWGTVWAAIGSVLGALMGFLLARYVNSGLVDLESMPRLGP